MAPDMQGYDAVIMANLLERTASPKAPLGRAVGQAPLVRVGGLILVASTFSWEEDIADKKLWLGGFSDKDGASVSSANRLRDFPGAARGQPRASPMSSSRSLTPRSLSPRAPARMM